MRLFEFEDLPWFPAVVRRGGTDFLRTILSASNFYGPIVPVLSSLIQKTNEKHILDLCSGSGGTLQTLREQISQQTGSPIAITLTDKFPARAPNGLEYHDEPVDVVKNIPPIRGIRTIFTAIHHFDHDQLRKVFINATRNGDPVAVFDGAGPRIPALLGIPLLMPPVFLLATPFIKPFRLSRILFTYFIPLIPLMTIWDGMASVIRIYPHDELGKIAAASVQDYEWISGERTNKWGIRISFLTGFRKNQ